MALKMEGAARTMEYEWPLEGGKGKKVDFPLAPLEGMQPCCLPDYSPVRPMPDFQPIELQNNKCGLF